MAERNANKNREADTDEVTPDEAAELSPKVRGLTMDEALDPDTLKDAVFKSPALKDASDDEKNAELERHQGMVAQARQYRQSRNEWDPIHSEPVVYVGQ